LLNVFRYFVRKVLFSFVIYFVMYVCISFVWFKTNRSLFIYLFMLLLVSYLRLLSFPPL